jgi:hypothetical protein
MLQITPQMKIRVLPANLQITVFSYCVGTELRRVTKDP